MDRHHPKAEVILVKNGLIQFVGPLKQANKQIDDQTQRIDLKGATLLPGFIDTHGHLSNVAIESQIIELYPAPKGVTNSLHQFQSTLKDFIHDQGYTVNMPIIAKGYTLDHTDEHRILTMQEMNAITDQYPLILVLADDTPVAVNSKMAEFLAITPHQLTAGIPCNEILKNNLRYLTLRKKLQLSQSNTFVQSSEPMRTLLSNQMLYLSHGYTTLSDAKSFENNINLLKSAAKHKMLLADVIYMADYQQLAKNFTDVTKYYNKYNNHLKMGGFKISLDGGLENQSAYMESHYPSTPHYKGYTIYDDQQLYQALHQIFASGISVQIHANGDAAVQQAIRVISGLKEIGIFKAPVTATLLHGQVFSKGQLEQIKRLGLGLSFTPIALKDQTKAYSAALSKHQLNNMFPLRQALEMDILTTIHQDAPIHDPNILSGVKAAVTRESSDGQIIGREQRVNVWQALQTITTHAAKQIGEQDKKGSIHEGKYADFVVLECDPFLKRVDSLDRIKVIKTIKNGQVIYQKDHHRPLYEPRYIPNPM